MNRDDMDAIIRADIAALVGKYYALTANSQEEWYQRYGPFDEMGEANGLMHAIRQHHQENRLGFIPLSVASRRTILFGGGFAEGYYNEELSRKALERLEQTPDRGEQYR